MAVLDRAGYSTSSHVLFWTVAAITAAADLVSKWWVFTNYQLNESAEIIPGFLFFSITKNPGAVFGFGAGKRWLFIGATVVAFIFIVRLFLESLPKQRVYHLLLALILGGAVGNLYDRIKYGKVRDFIDIWAGDFNIYPWVFNIADVALVIGVFGLLLGWLAGWLDVPGTCRVARPVQTDAADDVSCCSRDEVDNK